MSFISERDKGRAAAADRQKAVDELASLTTYVAKIRNVKLQLSSIDKEIAAKKNQVRILQEADPTGVIFSVQEQIDLLESEIKVLQTQRANISGKLNSLNLAVSLNKSLSATESQIKSKNDAKKITGTGIGAYKGINKNTFAPLQYNASSVRETYFSTRTDFINKVMLSHNQPTVIRSAGDLWTSVLGSKGMIVTSEQVLKAWNSGSNKATSADYFDKRNYGFQFQYNPGTVSMNYFTSPNVDVTMITSGTEMFNLAGVSGSQGSISFQIIINRIFDMQYYNGDGNLQNPERYPKRPASVQEEHDIYNKGTMYDLEFLLRVLMGTTMSSYLRGENTADMGWLPAIPVELHLGKSLRYLGIVNTLSVNHMIFNERMVPLFTTVNIDFVRLPDYPAGKSSDSGQPGAWSTSTSPTSSGSINTGNSGGVNWSGGQYDMGNLGVGGTGSGNPYTN
jgi:hypothetical protein